MGITGSASDLSTGREGGGLCGSCGLDLGSLTRRELEVLAGVVAGATNRAIARQFGLAERTVKAHLTSAMRKLRVGSRLEAALVVIGHRRMMPFRALLEGAMVESEPQQA
ncbi:helix-turn-helix transcriptional regulator [Streptomyces sp. NBC_00846]|uniref:helix-turn-helix domain-containing protein n=1 Tax=Streptomyces sp. NBC_00846 TaxID=2975849 RepID=UPI003866DB24|nr:helix-turn-helix transcriptional regulator [Streptomyces sp. NBC_00846]